MSEGIVAWWREDLGYGVAVMEDGTSVFLHKKHVIGPLPRIGQDVDFDLYEDVSNLRLVGLNIKIKERAY
jgi:cold shock CspA family protein